MTQYTPEEFASLLIRTFTPRYLGVPPGERPRAIHDKTDKGEDVLEFILPHPENRRFSASLTVSVRKGYVSSCSLRFGQAEVASALDPDDALAAMDEVMSDNIVAIVHYKNRNAYDDCRKVSSAPVEWLYQTPDDEEALNAMLEKLKKPATFLEKISGAYTGVFEVYRWCSSEILER